MKLNYWGVQLVNPYHQRPALILKITDALGVGGWGECSPLPALGTETIAESTRNLNTWQGELPHDFGKITDFCNQYNHLPALRHGIEQALLDRLAKSKSVPLCQLLNPLLDLASSQLKFNGLIGRVPPGIAVQLALNYRSLGINCLKVKVGQETFQASYDRLLAIHQALEGQVIFRLDPNQSWTVGDTIQYIRDLSFLKLDYLEQPLPKDDLDGLRQIRTTTGIGIAVDEGVRHLADLARLVSAQCADVVVLKPMLCGGLLSAYHLGQLAQQQGLRVVVSTSWEGQIGWGGAVHLALALQVRDPCGLSIVSHYQGNTHRS
ncbi:MAG: o-succinylbenzoate synthase [Pseudanabaenaceae cyanobacterium]